MHPHPVVVAPEELGAHLRKDRLAALADARHPGVHVKAARPVRPDRHRFVRAKVRAASGEELAARVPGAFHIGGETDAPVPAVQRAGNTPCPAVARPVDRLGGHAQAPLVVAAVVDGARRVDPWEVIRLHHVQRAQFHGVGAELPGQLVHHPFIGEIDLRLAAPAVSADRRLVGEDDAAFDESVVDLVRAVEDHGRQLR